MPEGILSIIDRFANLGNRIELTLINDEKVTGRFVEVNEIGIVIEVADKKRFVRGKKIEDFEIDDSPIDSEIRERHIPLKQDTASNEQSAKATEQAQLAKEDFNNNTLEGSVKDSAGESKANRMVNSDSSPKPQISEASSKEFSSKISVEEVPREIPKFTFTLFQGRVQIVLPEPDFKIANLIKEDLQEINRLKNKYEYAIKIRELNRIYDIFSEATRLAERLKHHAVYLLCGLLALKINRKREAKKELQLSLLYGSREAAVALAYLAVSEEKWKDSAEFLLQAFFQKEGKSIPETDILIAIGGCLSHMEDREIKGLGELQSQIVTEKGIEIFYLLVAFALELKNHEAALLSLDGNLIEASKLAINSSIFAPFPGRINTPIEAKLTPKDNKLKPATLFGHVSAVYPDRSFGFIISSEQETFFFRFYQVRDSDLRKNLQTNRTGQKVSFKRGTRIHGSKYDLANEIEWIDIEKEAPVKGPITIPKGDSTYAKAKLAEQTGELGKSEKLFRRVIEEGGKFFQSAIKDLAQLFNRRERGDEAIQLLDTYRSSFEDKKTLDNMKVSFYIKMKKFEVAAKLLHQLRKNAIYPEQANLLRQEAYCIMMNGEIDRALNILKMSIKKYPRDEQMFSLIQKIEIIRDSGKNADEEELEGLAGISSGLSKFAQTLIQSCDFGGLDEQAKARGFFIKRDFKEVERALDRSSRRPKERAKLLVTLATMTEKSPDIAGSRSIPKLIGRAFAFMGEAATYEGLEKDTVRFYLTEALKLAGNEELNIRFPISFLLSTYLPTAPAPGELLSNDQYDVERLIENLKHLPSSWKKFTNDFPYYYASSIVAMDFLVSKVKEIAPEVIYSIPFSEKEERTRLNTLEKQRKEYIAFQSLIEQRYTTSGNFQEVAKELLSLREKTFFNLDNRRILSLANMTEEAYRYWHEQDYIERESKFSRLINGLNTFSKEIEKEPTKLSFEQLDALAKRIKNAVQHDFEHYVKKAKPVLELNNILSDDYYSPDSNDIIVLRLELVSKIGGAPVEGIDILAHEDNGLKLVDIEHSPIILRGGERREVQLKVMPSKKQINEQVFTIRCYINYRNREGQSEKSKDYSFPVRIGDSGYFAPIENPYRNYAGGQSVDDPRMFKGRDDILQRITDIVKGEAVGQCFVLYGQKRSGKTSILNQLRKRLGKDSITISLTLGEIDIDHQRKQTNFIELCIEKIEEYLDDKLNYSLSTKPESDEIRQRPNESLRKVLRETKKIVKNIKEIEPRIIILIDEFTYLYEYIKEGIVAPTFMRNWKALLQMKLFNAVVVGQDSMPQFKQEYPNEFGVTFDERINYLSYSETCKLAEEPILFDGKSRYRGRALERLFELTAGSPFYTNIFCDRLVTYLNSHKAAFITEADIEAVLYGWKGEHEKISGLVAGTDILPIERFDPLITAAGESVAKVPRGVYIQILTAISKKQKRGGAQLSDLPQIDNLGDILKDMHDRDVIMIDAGKRYSIRVGLFAEWLHVNDILSGAIEEV